MMLPRRPGGACRLLVLALLALLASHHHDGGVRAAAPPAAGGRAAMRERHGAAGPPQPNAEASIVVAARQPLFDYAVAVGLAVLNATLQRAGALPDVRTTVEVPLIGGIDVAISGANVTALAVDPSLTRVAIEAGYFHATAANVTANMTFNWAWSKGPLGGSGSGELSFEGGALDAVFLVRGGGGGDEGDDGDDKGGSGGGGGSNDGGGGGGGHGGAPQVVVVSGGAAFAGLRLAVRADSADWLYQALLLVFGGAVRRQIEAAVDDALRTSVPAAINGALATVPPRVDVRGLPFSAVFAYALYTTSYVALRGFAEVEAPSPAPSSLAGAPLAAAIAAAANAATACPFPAAPLPLAPAQVGGDARMASLYAHESVPRCVLWALFEAGALRTAVRDGELPGLRLIADLFGAMMPDLPAAFKGRGLQLDVAATAAPVIAFGGGGAPAPSRNNERDSSSGSDNGHGSGNGGGDDDVTLEAALSIAVSVLNATGDGAALKVATLAANVTVAADVGWRNTTVSRAEAAFAVVEAAQGQRVLPDAWARATEWAARQGGAKLALSALWDAYAAAGAAGGGGGEPLFALENVVTGAAGGPGWRGLSADVRVTRDLLPPLPPPPSPSPSPSPPPSSSARPAGQRRRQQPPQQQRRQQWRTTGLF